VSFGKSIIMEVYAVFVPFSGVRPVKFVSAANTKKAFNIKAVVNKVIIVTIFHLKKKSSSYETLFIPT
jgi:hypothetical protein